MSRRWSIPLLALLAACPAPSDEQKPAPAPTPAPTPAKVEQPAAASNQPAPPHSGESSNPGETVAESTPKVAGPPPEWFRADAFEHTTIVRQDTSGARIPSGEKSSMIVLELPASVTPEQCIANFKAKLAETVKDPPTESVMPEGHLSLRGKTDTYSYSVVCGMAKGKPTMFMSYIQ